MMGIIFVIHCVFFNGSWIHCSYLLLVWTEEGQDEYENDGFIVDDVDEEVDEDEEREDSDEERRKKKKKRKKKLIFFLLWLYVIALFFFFMFSGWRGSFSKFLMLFMSIFSGKPRTLTKMTMSSSGKMMLMYQRL